MVSSRRSFSRRYLSSFRTSAAAKSITLSIAFLSMFGILAAPSVQPNLLSKPILSREPTRRDAARARAGAFPIVEVHLGAGALARAPGEAFGRLDHLRVGEAAVLIALQHHA